MKVESLGFFYKGTLESVALSEKDREKLMAMTNDEFEDELSDMLEEAEAFAEPAVLFGVCGVECRGDHAWVNGVEIMSDLAAEKLGVLKRCFPYVGTCGTALEEWSKQYAGDLLAEFWADEIKKYYVRKIAGAYFAFIKEQYHTSGHLTGLNPGSIAAWPISGQGELFAVLGGREFVKDSIGVYYTDSFLMLPSKSISGIAFESESFYENCQYCPLVNCPGRRAPRVET